VDVEPYDRERHDSMVVEWLTRRGIGTEFMEVVPTKGFIVADVAAGFLFQTDSKMALIDGIVSNPESDADVRDKALDDVFKALFVLARRLGFAVLWGFTPLPEVVARARQLGFTVDDERTYTFGVWRLF